MTGLFELPRGPSAIANAQFTPQSDSFVASHRVGLCELSLWGLETAADRNTRIRNPNMFTII